MADTFARHTLTMPDGHHVPYLLGGDGPLVVFAYSLDALARHCTVAILDWPHSDLEHQDVRDPAVAFTDLLAALHRKRGALCTWSMGGPDAIRFAATQPPRLSHLILVDPAGLTMYHGQRRGPLHAAVAEARRIGESSPAYVQALWHGWVHNPEIDTRPLEALMLRQQRRPGAFARHLHVNTTPPDPPLRELLPAITVPTLIITGRHSRVLGPNAAHEAVGYLTNGTLAISDTSGHAVQLEDPGRFQDWLTTFLQQ